MQNCRLFYITYSMKSRKKWRKNEPLHDSSDAVQKSLGIRGTSLTSLSEAQIFDAKLLAPLLKKLAD